MRLIFCLRLSGKPPHMPVFSCLSAQSRHSCWMGQPLQIAIATGIMIWLPRSGNHHSVGSPWQAPCSHSIALYSSAIVVMASSSFSSLMGLASLCCLSLLSIPHSRMLVSSAYDLATLPTYRGLCATPSLHRSRSSRTACLRIPGACDSSRLGSANPSYSWSPVFPQF